MERLTKKERDTEICYDQTDAPVQIRTHDLKLIRKLNRLAEAHPQLCRLLEVDEYNGSYYEVDKHRISVHVTKPYPEERRQKQSEWAKKHGISTNALKI